MRLGKKPQESSACTVCRGTSLVAAILLLVAAIASAVGAYNAHLLPDGFVFGSTAGSLSLLAFAVTLTFCVKTFHGCCTCNGEKK
jgi:membrane protein YdbS with pleckstrin-like domain